MKSFIMALFLLSTSVGNLMTAAVNNFMVRELPGASVASGAQTWVALPPGTKMVTGQKIDFNETTGLAVHGADGKQGPLAGTFLVAEVRGNDVRLMDNEHRQAVATTGTWNTAGGAVSTYKLVGPQYFNFFAYWMAAFGVVFIGVAKLYREQDYVRSD
jgi:POT family proton-dependent oligopeptide transporter